MNNQKLVRYDTVIIGTGLCAKFAFFGMQSLKNSKHTIKFLQVKNSLVKHPSVVLKHGGMANFWHKGFMSPGINVLNRYGIDKETISEFDNKFCPEIDHSRPKMLISNLSKEMFIAPKESTMKVTRINGIKIINDETKIIEVENGGNKQINCTNLIVCGSSIGNLEILNLTSTVTKEIYLNDHDMQILRDDPTVSKSPVWEEDSNSIKERRPSIMSSNGLKLSSKIGLLTIPLIGRILYGFHAPRLALEAVLKKIISPKHFYLFRLETPKKPVYVYKNERINSLSPIISAYHVIGDTPIEMKNLEAKRIFFLSGLNIGMNYKYFPSYLLALMSYTLGKKIISNE